MKTKEIKVNKKCLKKKNIFTEIQIFNWIEDFKQNINLLFAFKDYNKDFNVILVTNYDEVYYFGFNKRGSLGFGHESKVMELILNQNLSDKQIIDFKNSLYQVIARISDVKVYCRGCNIGGSLGNGKNDDNEYNPELNLYLCAKQIKNICCGFINPIKKFLL